MRRKTAKAIGGAVLAAFLQGAVGLAQTPGGDAAAQCRALCAQHFARDEGKREQCEAGCAEAQVCVSSCKERFADEEKKRSLCIARCAR